MFPSPFAIDRSPASIASHVIGCAAVSMANPRSLVKYIVSPSGEKLAQHSPAELLMGALRCVPGPHVSPTRWLTYKSPRLYVTPAPTISSPRPMDVNTRRVPSFDTAGENSASAVFGAPSET